MDRFPAEFADLLNAQGKHLLEADGAESLRMAPGEKIVLREGLIDPAVAAGCVRLLDRHIHPVLRVLEDRIPPGSISKMKKNYSEALPKTLRMKTCFLSSRRFQAFEAADRIGLVSMLESESVRRFAEMTTGLRLKPPTAQVICYETGDYVSPHNDHHPENEDVKHGYVDVHIMFGNEGVAHHWLVYERDRHLNQIRNVNVEGGIAVYRLPFWHYTTPLAARPGHEESARRWLLLSTFEIVRGRQTEGKPCHMG